MKLLLCQCLLWVIDTAVRLLAVTRLSATARCMASDIPPLDLTGRDYHLTTDRMLHMRPALVVGVNKDGERYEQWMYVCCRCCKSYTKRKVGKP